MDARKRMVMAEDFSVIGIVPVVAVADVAASVAFYERYLGCKRAIVMPDGSYAVVLLGNGGIHFQRAADDDVLRATARTMQFRVRVHDVDAWWERLRGVPTKTREPRDEPWHAREFHVLDPDGALVIVTQGRESAP